MVRIRAVALALSLLWQQAAAQDGGNNLVIPTGQNTYEVTAGQPLTVEWTNPSSGTVTIRLQQEIFNSDGAIILAAGIPASTLTATLAIPAAEQLNSSLYLIEIIDDIDPNNFDFSPSFFIDLVTGSASSATSETSATPTTTETSINPITTNRYDDSGPDTTRSETSSATSTADQTGTSESNGASPTLSTPVIVAIAIGGAIGAFALGGLWFYSLRLYRRDKKMWAMACDAVQETHDRQDHYQAERSQAPGSYRLDGPVGPKTRELLSMMRTM